MFFLGPQTCNRARRAWAALLLAVAIPFLSGNAVQATSSDFEGWTTAQSGPFRLLTHADSEQAAELLVDLERFRRAFAEFAPGIDAGFRVPIQIVAFRDGASYEPFKSQPDERGASGVRILGQFLSHRDGNFITVNVDPRVTGGLGIVLHEYVHHLLNQNLPRVPRWLNEGLAEYYSTFQVEGAYAVIGRPVVRHLRWWRESESAAVLDVLEVEPGSAHSLGGAGAGEFYAVSWGLVHYLLGTPGGPARLAAYLEAVAGGAGSADSLLESLDLSASKLEEELRRHLVGGTLGAASLPLGDLGSIEVAEAAAAPDYTSMVLGELAARLGHERQADVLFDSALSYRSDNAEALAGLAMLRERERRFEEAKYLYTDALAAGPRSARTYLRHGRHLLQRLEQESPLSTEQKRQLALRARVSFEAAAALEPRFAESYVMLATVHLFSDLDANEGVAFGDRALRLLPTRVDVVHTLIRLHLKAGALDRARALLEGSFRVLASSDDYSRAVTEVRRAELLVGSREAISELRWQDAVELFDQAISHTEDLDLRLRMEEQLERLQRQADRASGKSVSG